MWLAGAATSRSVLVIGCVIIAVAIAALPQSSSSSMDQLLQSARSALESLRGLSIFLSPDGGDSQGVQDGHCTYRCATKGRTPRPRPGYKATFNGCGSQEFRIDTSAMPEITRCCNQHDICYGTCNLPKSACEAAFKTCLAGACDKMRATGGLPDQRAFDTCRGIGETFHETVVNFGCDFYLDAQAAACECGDRQAAADRKRKPKGPVVKSVKEHHSFLDFASAQANEEL